MACYMGLEINKTDVYYKHNALIVHGVRIIQSAPCHNQTRSSHQDMDFGLILMPWLARGTIYFILIYQKFMVHGFQNKWQATRDPTAIAS
jgi:hypothetical protein